jgi:hypothetical protein
MRQKSGACVTVRVLMTKRQTLTIAAIHDQHYVLESGRPDLGSESFTGGKTPGMSE